MGRRQARNGNGGERDPPPMETVVIKGRNSNSNGAYIGSSGSSNGSIESPSNSNNNKNAKDRAKQRWPVLGFALCYLLCLVVLSRISYSRHLEQERALAEKERELCLQEERKKKKNPFRALQPVVKGWQKVFHREKKTRRKKKGNISFSKSTTVPPKLSQLDLDLISQLSYRTHQSMPGLHARVAKVGWAGSAPWWSPVGNQTGNIVPEYGASDGGYVLYAHYRIMKKSLQFDTWETKFPFSFCKPKSCPAEVSLQHTLSWREVYQPWTATPSVLKENAKGWVYTRGLSKPLTGKYAKYGRHALVWVRPGHHKVQNGYAYFRAILHTVDVAISKSIQDSQGRVGKFNVIVDADQYEWGKMPDLKSIKLHLAMMQDHYPDRLGMLFLANVSRSAEFFVNIVKKLLTQEVRDKIVVLSNNEEEREAQLEAFLDPQYIPTWLGGTDDYRVDLSEYYPPRMRITEAEGSEWLKKLPQYSK